MARAHYFTYLLDEEGRPISGATVTVRDPGTTDEIAATIYAEDDSVGNTTKTNPFTAAADGLVELWLNTPANVDLFVQKTGYTSQTRRVSVFALSASNLTVQDAGTPMTQRATLDFQDGFVLADDAGNAKTAIDLDYAGTGEIADVAAAEGAGTSPKVARGDHVHAHPSIASGDLHPEYTTLVTNHTGDATDAHDASAISIADAGNDFTATDVEGALAELQADNEAHVAAADPHTGYVLESAHTKAAHDALSLSHDSLADVSVNDHHNEVHQATKHDAVVLTVYLTTDESCANNTNVVVTGVDFTEVIDTDSLGGTDGRIMKVPAGYAGKWRVSGQVAWASDSTGRRACFLRKNGADDVIGVNLTPSGTVGPCVLPLPSNIVALAEGDWFDVLLNQNSGGALACKGGEFNTFFSFEFVGA